MTPTERLLIAILDGHRPFFTPGQTPHHDARCSSVCHTHHRKDELMAEQYPLWTQDQAIAYEAARDAINDVIAGYSAQIEAARQVGDEPRVTWLNMRIDQARDVAHFLDVSDNAIVAQVLQEFSAVAQVQAGGLPPAV